MLGVTINVSDIYLSCYATGWSVGLKKHQTKFPSNTSASIEQDAPYHTTVDLRAAPTSSWAVYGSRARTVLKALSHERSSMILLLLHFKRTPHPGLHKRHCNHCHFSKVNQQHRVKCWSTPLKLDVQTARTVVQWRCRRLKFQTVLLGHLAEILCCFHGAETFCTLTFMRYCSLWSTMV